MAANDEGGGGVAAIVSVLSPLLVGVSNPESFGQLLRRFGLDSEIDEFDLEQILTVSGIGSLTDSIRTIDVNDPTADLEVLLEAIQSLFIAIDRLRSLDATLFAPPLDELAWWRRLADKLIGVLIADALYEYAGPLWATLNAVGVNTPMVAGELSPQNFGFSFERLGELFNNPATHLKTHYGWATPSGIQVDLVLASSRMLAESLGLRSISEPTPALTAAALLPAVPHPQSMFIVATTTYSDDVFVEYLAGIRVCAVGRTADTPTGLAFVVELEASSTPTESDDLFEVAITGSLDAPIAIIIEPSGIEIRGPAGTQLDAGVELKLNLDDPAILFGDASGTRLELHGAHAGLGVSGNISDPLVRLGIGIGVDGRNGLKLVIDLSDLGFIATTAGADAITAELAGTLTWSNAAGFGFNGSAALNVRVASTLEIGPLKINRFEAGVVARPSGIEASLGVALAVVLGPVMATVDRIGLGATMEASSGGGAFGTGDLQFRALLPRAISLEVDSGVVVGSGFLLLDTDTHRYAGSIDLSVYDIRVAALGVLQTHLPAPGPEFSLLLVLNAQFPGLQLGFGLTLNGISGLLALHRTSDPDALRSSLANGAIGQLLTLDGAADDPIAFLATLDSLFPVRAGRHVIGIGVQLRWILVVRFDVMVAIEIPGPARILILGSARAELAVGDADLLRLRLDVLGIVDFERRELSIDAALVDSSLLDIFDIHGGAAVRMSWGSQPYVVMSVGGFHPDFIPEPTILPILARVGISSGQPGDLIYFRLDGYFAVTTNTVQFGAHAELRINAGPLRALGELGFDALIQFDPFWFIFDFRARFSISIAGISLAGASINGSLSGPGPMIFRGEVCIEILFFDICWSGTIESGRSIDQPARTVESVVRELQSEITAQNVTSTAQSNAPVLVELTTDASDRPIVASDGTLSWAQTKAPLGMPLELFEGVPLVEPVIVEPTVEARLIEEWFAPASFAAYSDSEAINLPAFERMPGGFDIPATGTLQGIVGLPFPVTVDEIILPDPEPVSILVDVWPLWFATEPEDPAPLLAVHNEQWILETDTGVLMARGSAAVIGQHARLRGLVATPEGDDVSVEGL